MLQDYITIKGARVHNLKNINVKIPINSLTVITGVSGSGKSSLAFDTLYAEGQRRYVESLSVYARQFLGIMQKPDIDSIKGLSPAISIEQKSVSKNPRSTVGTTTEMYDYLRLLFARAGRPYCPFCHKLIKSADCSDIAQMIYNKLKKNDKEKKIQILAPIVKDKKGRHEQMINSLKRKGFARVRIDNVLYDLDEELPKLNKNIRHKIEVIVDRLKISPKQTNLARLIDSIETAVSLSNDLVMIILEDKEFIFSRSLTCPDCEVSIPELSPGMFSFNSPAGACLKCHGLGFVEEFDINLMIPDKGKSLDQDAIVPLGLPYLSFYKHRMKRYCRSHNIKLYEPISLLSNQSLNKLLYGDSLSAYKGVIPVIKQLNRNSLSERRKRELSKYIRKKVCPQCLGKRLNHLSLNVKINGYSIFDLTDVSIDKLKNFLTKFKFSKKELKIVRNIIKEINNRLNFLIDVGLNYLTLNRLSSTLSGGEAQRIRLATQIGSELRGVMYILDEPSIGLHQRDNYRLIKTLKKLRDLKNTVIVVEHDKQIMNEADYIVDIGPKAGRNGGDLVVSGTPSVVKNCSKSITGQYLLGIKNIKPKNKTRIARDFLEIVGAKENNLKNINVKFPLGVLCCVTGVSGSGKSSLVNEILYKGLKTEIHASTQIPGKYKKIINISKIDKVICIDQSPIGRTPRSNPATYIKVFDYIRNLFSKTKEARVRGYKPGRFSFNVPNGRCEHCRGDGILKIEMHFLPDIYVTCEKCKGKRYSKETLEVTYKGRNIAEILNMTVEEALKFFKNVPAIYKKLHMLNDVGLGYIKLGQSATTLSGGEAQRVKLTLELAKRDTGKTLYILDEPTTGLHFDDVKKLLDVLDKLVSKGNSVIIIEHNLDVIKTADYIIDLGPLGGTKGGYIVAKGAPRVVAQNKDSHTGVFLKTIFKD